MPFAPRVNALLKGFRAWSRSSAYLGQVEQFAAAAVEDRGCPLKVVCDFIHLDTFGFMRIKSVFCPSVANHGDGQARDPRVKVRVFYGKCALEFSGYKSLVASISSLCDLRHPER
jgi:hypothetical protein